MIHFFHHIISIRFVFLNMCSINGGFWRILIATMCQGSHRKISLENSEVKKTEGIGFASSIEGFSRALLCLFESWNLGWMGRKSTCGFGLPLYLFMKHSARLVRNVAMTVLLRLSYPQIATSESPGDFTGMQILMLWI